MLRSTHVSLSAVLLLGCLTLAAQERGLWRAASSTAKAITGDVALSDQQLTLNFLTFPIARIRPLTQPELSAAFDADPSAPGAGSLYRVDISATKKFLHKNSLCGADDAQWMATYATARQLHIAFFSDPAPPVLTLEALANSATLCGTFTYVK
jgi:hypothetical protein